MALAGKTALVTGSTCGIGLGNLFANLGTISQGIPGFFAPNHRPWFAMHTPLGVADAGFYTTAPLRETLMRQVDLGRLAVDHTRLTLGAVNARSGCMRYFDSHEEILSVEHVMASGALPPAFPVIVIDGDAYWDGGTVMHIVPLRAPRIEGEDHSKDIDFTSAGIRVRWDAGREFARRKIEAAPWEAKFDPVMGVVLHE